MCKESGYDGTMHTDYSYEVKGRLQELLDKGWTIAAIADALETDRETVSVWANRGNRRLITLLALQHPSFDRRPPPKKRYKGRRTWGSTAQVTG